MVRRISFMASLALFRLPILNLVLPIVGCFPKDKGVKDRDAMATSSAPQEDLPRYYSRGIFIGSLGRLV